MAEIISGALVAEKIKEDIKTEIKEYGLSPRLALVRVGKDPADLAYESRVLKVFGPLGIDVKVTELPAGISQKELEREFKNVCENPASHGVMLFRPLKAPLSDRPLAEMIPAAKDVDCMSPESFKLLALGADYCFAPCTAEAVMKTLEYAGAELCGANAVVIGRSLVIGRPLGLMLLSRNATVTWCHSYTRNIPESCGGADIIVSCCGVPRMIKAEHVKNAAKGCIVIDVGMNFEDGKPCGDVDLESVSPFVAKITPVPGGVGAVTNAVLASHVVHAAKIAKAGETVCF